MKTRIRHTNRTHAFFAATCGLYVLTAACGSRQSSPRPDIKSTESQNAFADAGKSEVGPAYIVGSTHNTPDGWNAYVAAIPGLVEQELDYSEALEIAGRADVWVTDGRIFIGQADSPTVTRYALSADLEFEQEEEPISFALWGLSGGQFWNAIWLTPEKAYMNNLSGQEYVIWDPSTMSIEGSTPHPDLPEVEGYVVRTSSTNRGSITRDGKLYHSYYWTNEEYTSYTPESAIAVYDIETDELLSVIDAPCPGLEVATMDDDGNIYYSSWTGLPGLHLVLEEPAPCTIKLPAGEDKVDTSWTIHWPDITDGRHGASMLYQGNGHALVSIFHDEDVEYDSKSDAFEIIGTENWKLWRISLEDKTAEPVEDIAPNSGAIYLRRIGDYSYALVPTTDYASSIVYQVDGASAEPLFETLGWSTRLFQLR